MENNKPKLVQDYHRESEERLDEMGNNLARVVVTACFVNIATMQVCAVVDASDEEILEVCNRENRSGTSNGWSEVIRTADPDSMFKDENKLPVTCSDNPNRKHFLVLC